MNLIDILQLIHKSGFPPTLYMKNGKVDSLDTRPSSVYEVTLCFMCEKSTWVTCNIQNAVLIPWYDCEVTCIEPNADNPHAICVWLKDEEYLKENYSKHLKIIKEKENRPHYDIIDDDEEYEILDDYEALGKIEA